MWNDYTYNSLNGNRTGLTYHSATGTASTVSYTYPTATSARPHAVTTVAGPVDLGAGTYGYDAAGNMTSAPGQTITFDDVGKVTKVVAGSVTVSNIYDASGNLLLRTSSGSEGSSLYVGDTVLSQAKGSSVVAGFRTYVGPEGKPVAQRSAKTGTAGTVFTWLFSNHDGTVDTQTVAKTGATTRSYRDPFGVPIGGSTGVWANGNGFLNKPVVGSTKLTTIGARTYAAVIGKFISVDPVTDARRPQQNTGYAYSGNNPITFSDPTGLILDEGCGGWHVKCGASASTPSAPVRVGGELPAPNSDGNWCGVGDWSCRVNHAMSQRGKTPAEAGVPCQGRHCAGMRIGLRLWERDYYSYEYSHVIHAPFATPEGAMNTFKNFPKSIFPFQIGGCDTFSTGDVCTLYPGTPKFPPPVPADNVGIVGVNVTDTSVKFTVLEWGYFDGPGSTIDFSTSRNSQGDLLLTQSAVAYHANGLLAFFIKERHASEKPWQQQAQNLEWLLNGP
ncbi:RHS repeat domain-containing protein [Microbacterium gorillae]|uniref:RHS repeat domain-containing protein n=1 Tax=Microbacterium gorillae TaxID=1231063 RepID=UPI003D985996